MNLNKNLNEQLGIVYDLNINCSIAGEMILLYWQSYEPLLLISVKGRYQKAQSILNKFSDEFLEERYQSHVNTLKSDVDYLIKKIDKLVEFEELRIALNITTTTRLLFQVLLAQCNKTFLAS